MSSDFSPTYYGISKEKQRQIKIIEEKLEKIINERKKRDKVLSKKIDSLKQK